MSLFLLHVSLTFPSPSPSLLCNLSVLNSQYRFLRLTLFLKTTSQTSAAWTLSIKVEQNSLMGAIPSRLGSGFTLLVCSASIPVFFYVGFSYHHPPPRIAAFYISSTYYPESSDLDKISCLLDLKKWLLILDLCSKLQVKEFNMKYFAIMYVLGIRWMSSRRGCLKQKEGDVWKQVIMLLLFMQLDAHWTVGIYEHEGKVSWCYMWMELAGNRQSPDAQVQTGTEFWPGEMAHKKFYQWGSLVSGLLITPFDIKYILYST